MQAEDSIDAHRLLAKRDYGRDGAVPAEDRTEANPMKLRKKRLSFLEPKISRHESG